MNYFTSDLHLGHKAICKYRTKFKTTQEHDEYMIQEIEKLKKRDILYVLGDFLFDGDHYDEYIKRLRAVACRIKVVLGNHDSLELYKENENDGSIEIQLPLFSYKNFWLSHAPIHPGELRGRNGNIHGHMHLEKLIDERYYNVNIDVNDYKFVKFDDIKELFEN